MQAEWSYVYILLDVNSNPVDLENRFPEFLEKYILNETAVKMIGWTPEQAIGKQFKLTPGHTQFEGGVIHGVVKDHNFSTMKKTIKSLVLFQRPIWYFCFLIKIDPININRSLNYIKNRWHEIFPDSPFEYIFVDELFSRLYKSELRQSSILGIFSGLGIFIACLGLLGLAAFTIERRTKEIGLRKVLGASVSGITFLLSKEFTNNRNQTVQ